MLLYFTLAVYILFSAEICNALVSRTSLPPSFTVQELGFTTESNTTFGRVGRDGGGGGLVNGNQLIVFSDTETTNANDQIVGFTSNSAAYFDGNDPTSLTDFGQNGVPDLGIPWLANESAWKDANSAAQKRLIIWPESSISTLPDGVSGVAVYPVSELSSNGGSVLLYNTMVQYTPNSSGPQATRAVPQLFYTEEAQNGSFGSAISNIDGNLLLFAKTPVDESRVALKVARVDPNSATDRTQYSYWDGSEWSATPIPPSSTAGNILSNWCGLTSGDLFFNPYLNTWVFIYFDNFANSIFYMRYSLDGDVTGTWSDQITLYETTPVSNKFNYAAHAYPGYDESGKTVLLSWTYGRSQTKMATVTFA